MKMKKPTVIDFFCGAGGFSEGFRQQGFEIVKGYDKWEPAIRTFNHNFCLDEDVCDISRLSKDLQAIEEIPDTDIIIGSPPCVSFSNSNKSGKADKSIGLRLTEAFLKIVAIKKFKKNSILKAWFMENVSNSLNYLQDHYTFKELDLNDWAINNGYTATEIAIHIKGNSTILNAAEYGSAQSRKRAITGEIIKKGKLVCPRKTHSLKEPKSKLPEALTLKKIKRKFPRSTNQKSYRKFSDPLYPTVLVNLNQLTDHFYDTGLYECEWKSSHFMKRNHPYMGRMSFPENEDKPSRTITATNIGTSREAIIYRSGYKRKGDGEYRVPTVREMATLMGFPITYQFLGRSESSKCRLIGNAVCIAVSRALAKVVRKELGLRQIKKLKLEHKPNLKSVLNLNTYKEKVFDSPPKKNKGSRFRRHPFKDGNITVTLSNYDINKNTKIASNWITSVQHGNGDGFPTYNIPNGYYLKLEPLIKEIEQGSNFLNIINNGFSEKIGSGKDLQRLYEKQKSNEQYLEPTQLIENVAKIISNLKLEKLYFIQKEEKIFKKKERIPVKQLFALYAINKISSLASR